MKIINRDILKLALPSILANITVPLVGMVDIAVTGPREPLGGNLISGSVTFTLLLRTTGICIGAIGTLAMIA